MGISDTDLAQLLEAKRLLERPNLAATLTHRLGTPIEKGFELLPESWSVTIRETVDISLNRAMELAMKSLAGRAGRPWERLHTLAAVITGATGGFFGLPGLVIELPISTAIIFRSIASIARSEGADLESIDTRLDCLEVFALGGRSRSDDSTETGYFAIRSALAKSVSDATRYLAERGLSEKGAPVLIGLISKIASRFGIVVSQKAAAMAIPAIGAAGAAAVNSIFVSHFQKMAHGHFVIRRLERQYDPELIETEYHRLKL